ncbi:MAG: DNRLRE domain-containing protein [Planctomycetota bacterium]|nr:DNRLRE domain-containing protein [Planctomycetota bacterium]
MHTERFALLCVLLLAAAGLAQAEETRCPASRDVWISAANRQESDTNGGKAPRIKLKVWQEYGLIDFDVSALKGKKIASAALHVKAEGGGVHGGKRGTDLRWFSVSTVSGDWVEGDGTQYSVDDKGKGATFNEASYKTRPWAFKGSKNWDVILGNGNTLRDDVDGGDPQGGWFTLPIKKELVQALVAKASHGLMIMDGSTGVDRNCYIAAKESGNGAPYLTVTLEGDDAQAPAAPASLKLEPAPNDAGMTEGAARLTFKVPQDAFAYQIKVNGTELPRWQVPFAGKAGEEQSIVLEFLAPGSDLTVELAAVDTAGNVSPAASVKGKASPAITVPRLPASAWQPKGGSAPVAGDKLKVWAYPEICKLDPLTGAIVLEKDMDGAASKNAVWDAGSSTVRVAAARGDIGGFQLALERLGGNLDDVTVEVAAPEGVQVKLWRNWFVKIGNAWQAEYAIPVKAGEALAIPAADNQIPEQKCAAIAVDLIVPEGAKPGDLTGSVTVKAGGASVKLNLQMKIYETVIPKEIHFNPEMNCYNGPGQAGSPYWFDAFRIAHYHRSTINRVPYSQSGNIHGDYVPAVGPDGKVTDWSNFDKNIGPLLDGSAFKDNPRAGVPVATLYLPQNENWPVSMHAHYNPGAPTSGDNWKAKHDVFAKAPEDSFSKAYQDAWTANIADFVKHFEEKGWTKTHAELYLNNKYNFGKEKMGGTAWTMDEPFEYLDWRALIFYSKLFHAGTKDAKGASFYFRGDISRPMWQGSCMDGLMEIMYVGGGGFDMARLIKAQKEKMPTVLYAYGGCNDNNRPNHETTAWCLKSYVYEHDGVLPWQSIGGDDAFVRGDNGGGNGNALIVDGSKRFGVNAIASFRVHAFRVGAQNCELLRLVLLKNKWSRMHAGALVEQFVPLGSEYIQKFTDDAAATTFGAMNGNRFVELKESLLTLLAR